MRRPLSIFVNEGPRVPLKRRWEILLPSLLPALFLCVLAIVLRNSDAGVILLGVSGVLPAGSTLLLFCEERRLKNRWMRGECIACGCDLVGKADGVCPECGAPVKAHPKFSGGIL